MNHILKKVIQCVVCFFCVLGMISTTGKRIKAEGGSIYSNYGKGTCDSSGCKPANNWRKSTNLNGSGSYYLAYSENENDDITTSELAPIDASKVFLTNNDGDTPVDTTNVIYFSSNYIELNLDNLAVGEYTLKIEDSSMKITVEKSYVVLKDSNGNEYTLNQQNSFNLNVGTKYTITEVYKETGKGNIDNYTISDVSDNGNPFINITQENGLYIIEPKEEFENYRANLKISTQEGRSFWLSYLIVSNSHIYTNYLACDNTGCNLSPNWNKSSNINGSGSFYLAYSQSENDNISSSELETINASDVSLTNNNGDTPVDTTNVIYFSPNYIELNLDNLAVGEYTLKIKDSSKKISVEKDYVVLVDDEGNEYKINPQNPVNFNFGIKYTIKEAYRETVKGNKNYTISSVSDNGNPFISITQENGKYVIEAKEGFGNARGNFKVDTQEGPSFYLSYQVCNFSGTGKIQINDDNSFVITFEDTETLDSISQNSMLYLEFLSGANNAAFMLKGGIKNDGDKTLTFDSRVLSCGGSYISKGSYDVNLRQENNTWNLKGNGEGGKVTLNHDINKKAPSGLSYSLTKEDGFKLTCSESEACSAYLDTFYDTNVDSKGFLNTGYWTSGISGNGFANGHYGQSLDIPYRANMPQLFEKITKNDKTIALTIPFNSFTKNSNTGFNWGYDYSLKIHVLGFEDFYFNNNLKLDYDFPDKLPDGWTFDVKWDDENKKIIYISNHRELFENTEQFTLEGVNKQNETMQENISLDAFYQYTITESNGLYYLTIDNHGDDSGYGYNVTVKLFNNKYGTIQAANTINLSNFEGEKSYPDDLVVKIIADGIVIQSKDTKFIENAIKDNVSIRFCDVLIGENIFENYTIDNTKYRFKKISNTQIKLDITAEELMKLENDGKDITKKFDINSSYYQGVILKNYYISDNEFKTYFKVSFEPIILADAIGKTNSTDELKKLDGYATGLQNVTVKDEETNNTGVSIVGNVAGAITENYERGNENSDLNLLPESDSDKEIITVKTDIKSLDAEKADELASKAGGRSTISIDVSISKEYAKDSNKNTEVTELPYDSNLTFNLSETNENETYVVVREHKESDGKTSYTLLDVTENEDGKTGSISSNKFSKFALVKQNILDMVEAPKGSTNEGSKTSLKFKTMVKATNVYLDNELIDPNNYEAEDDGTVTLKPEYVSKLSVGKHTLKIITKEGMASSEFEVSAKSKGDNNTSSSVETKGWDDGGPFTTDKCGNVFDRWNNKIYEANGCNVGGYNLVRTDTID